MNRIRAGIVGASGYTGFELIKILSKHKNVELVFLNSKTYEDKTVQSLYPEFKDSSLKFTNVSVETMNEADVVFLAVPSGAALDIVPKLTTKIIDLSADYRFKDEGMYEKVYGKKHTKAIDSVYGLPELHKKEIQKARVVANPGCYPTASLLATLPIQKKAANIILDCKSGFSGAGVKPCYVNKKENYTDNIIPYKITNHRHVAEIQQYSSAPISFTPHVIPTFRGMLCTAHIFLNEKEDAAAIKKQYDEFYKQEPFVEIVDTIPDLHDVQNTNLCRIGGFEIDDAGRLVIISVIDNLLKGASGQAVQNMNLMFGLEETTGLN